MVPRTMDLKSLEPQAKTNPSTLICFHRVLGHSDKYLTRLRYTHTVVQTPGFFLQGHREGLPPNESLALVKNSGEALPKEGCQ